MKKSEFWQLSSLIVLTPHISLEYAFPASIVFTVVAAVLFCLEWRAGK